MKFIKRVIFGALVMSAGAFISIGMILGLLCSTEQEALVLFKELPLLHVVAVLLAIASVYATYKSIREMKK